LTEQVWTIEGQDVVAWESLIDVGSQGQHVDKLVKRLEKGLVQVYFGNYVQ